MASPPNKILCVILGAGGHARVVVDCLKMSGQAYPYAALDRNPSLWEKEILGVPIRGGEDLLDKLKKEGVTHFIPAVGGTHDNSPRRRIFKLGIEAGLIPLTLCHPSAIVSSYSKIGRGSVVFAGVILNPGVVIGENCIINTGAIIDHDCVIGDHVHIAPGSTLSGMVEIKVGAHVGTGASIRQGICVGEESVIGAGSVVIENVPDKTVVKGVPAR